MVGKGKKHEAHGKIVGLACGLAEVEVVLALRLAPRLGIGLLLEEDEGFVAFASHPVEADHLVADVRWLRNVGLEGEVNLL
ncbi:MAG: hypothetical protein EBU90_30450 [Proteobacteria bacterium]|nr:hypothetical protein [Pseudomonadota bacterium]